jgi:hypothetical protein
MCGICMCTSRESEHMYILTISYIKNIIYWEDVCTARNITFVTRMNTFEMYIHCMLCAMLAEKLEIYTKYRVYFINRQKRVQISTS